MRHKDIYRTLFSPGHGSNNYDMVWYKYDSRCLQNSPRELLFSAVEAGFSTFVLVYIFSEKNRLTFAIGEKKMWTC